MRRPRRHPGHATVVAYLALFVALGGTGAYAANTIRSEDIVDGEVKAADIGVGQVLGSRISDGTVKSEDVADNRLTGADIDETTLRTAQGPGTRLLANRMTLVPGDNKLLLTIPGLGEVYGECGQASATIFWFNSTSSGVETWSERESGTDTFAQTQVPATSRIFASSGHFSGERHYTELSVGTGTSPGQRRMATLHGFARLLEGGCSVHVSGVSWQSGG